MATVSESRPRIEAFGAAWRESGVVGQTGQAVRPMM